MDTQIDSLTIKDLETRYGVTRSNVYNRIDGLKKKGYQMEPEKQGGKSVFNADQIVLMDDLDAHIKAGGTIGDFGASNRPIGQLETSYRTQDTPTIQPADPAPLTFGMGAMIEAIAAKVVDILELRQSGQSTPPDPLIPQRQLEEISDRGWVVTSSQLRGILGVQPREGNRLGFRLVKGGRAGREMGWKVEKSSD